MDNQNRQEAEDLISQVQNIVSEVLESIESGQFNQAVKGTVGSALEGARKQLEQYKARQGDRRSDKQTGSSEAVVKKPLKIRVNWKGRVSGILFTVFGGIGTGVFGLLALLFLIFATFFSSDPRAWWLIGICAAFTLGFGGMLWKGISRNGRIGRLKQYIAELKQRGKTYCEIETLGRSCGRSSGFIKKDLKKMIALGMLPDARMDEEGTWLMLDEETYHNYELFHRSQREKQEEEKQKAAKQKEEKKRAVSKTEENPQKKETAVEAAVRQGREYMEVLDRLRESIAGEPVREKLIRLDAVLERLFITLEKHPEQLEDMEKFMEYYLPATGKLVTTYQELVSIEFPGENIKAAKAEIEKTLDTINKAFEKLLDDMYEDTAFDIITDAAVLETMFAREGITGQGDDFQKGC